MLVVGGVVCLMFCLSIMHCFARAALAPVVGAEGQDMTAEYRSLPMLQPAAPPTKLQEGFARHSASFDTSPTKGCTSRINKHKTDRQTVRNKANAEAVVSIPRTV